ncbi:MAG: amidohydrolase family protein [SAR202 cluster bacterium]|jgi:hypothetical protein|nr:amidohydrolase family protein [SAR202 cluster bacterium]
MRAIDMHVHVPRQEGLAEIAIESSLRRYFRLKTAPETGDELAALYAEWDILGVIFSVDTETTSSEAPDSNDYVAQIVSSHPEQFIGFATVDPWKGETAVEEMDRAVHDLGLRGLKLHPIHQAFFPNDEQFYPLYEKCQALGIPLLMHSGFAAAGVGMPGGGGFKLKYAKPIPGFDDVAADFPDLTIIMAHPAWPWIEEQIAVALHKPNVYLDLSGWAPRYIPEGLVREADTRLRDKVLFGSDFPYISPDRWLSEFSDLPIRDEVRPKILLENARRILGL